MNHNILLALIIGFIMMAKGVDDFIDLPDDYLNDNTVAKDYVGQVMDDVVYVRKNYVDQAAMEEAMERCARIRELEEEMGTMSKTMESKKGTEWVQLNQARNVLSIRKSIVDTEESISLIQAHNTRNAQSDGRRVGSKEVIAGELASQIDNLRQELLQKKKELETAEDELARITQLEGIIDGKLSEAEALNSQRPQSGAQIDILVKDVEALNRELKELKKMRMSRYSENGRLSQLEDENCFTH